MAVCPYEGSVCWNRYREWVSIRVNYLLVVVDLRASMFTGVYASMLAAPIISMGDTRSVGVRVGMFFSVLALGALAGPPISGAINTATGGYKAVGYYAGNF
jgi:MFS transporter, MCT family, solute carrier family 16 (monocarboxylic acid transporters), member 10